jgi:hypothetical protein
MELSLLMKLRIGAAMAVGVVLVGILAWQMAGPSEPAGAIGGDGATILILLAFVAGLGAYFVSWPYGRQIGVLAAPSGLAVWAVRSGSMTTLMQLNPTVTQRQEVLAVLRWEPVFWLLIVAAGFAGVLLGEKIRPGMALKKTHGKHNFKSGKYLNMVVALIGSGLIAQFCIRILAQDISMSDSRWGSVMSQPAVGQIVFGVLVSFGLAAFLVKKFLDASYIWPTIAAALVTAVAVTLYVKQMQHVVQGWPAAFFSNAVVSILPVQMVAFGALGSIAGYWMAVRYSYWRKHEPK